MFHIGTYYGYRVTKIFDQLSEMIVLLAATRASEAALGGTTGDGWPWVRLLGVFAVIYVAFGVVAFGPLLEESS